MKVLLTGATGFLGSNFLSYSNGKADLELYLLTSKQVEDYNCIIHNNYSFSKEEIPAEIDVLIHAGAFSPKNRMDLNNIEKLAENIITTNYLLNHVVFKKIIYISSISVYNSLYTNIIDENTQTEPDTMYGTSKLFCEKIVESFCKKNNIDYLIIRPGVIYGAGDVQEWIIPTAIRKLAQGEPLTVYNGGHELKSFIHVLDCCRVIYKAVFTGVNDKIINLVSSYSLPVRKFMEILIEINEKDLFIIDKKVNKIYNNTLYDNTRMIKAFGDTTVNYYEGIKEAYEYYVKNIKTKDE